MPLSPLFLGLLLFFCLLAFNPARDLTRGVFKNPDLSMWIVPISASPTSELTEQKIMQKFPF